MSPCLGALSNREGSRRGAPRAKIAVLQLVPSHTGGVLAGNAIHANKHISVLILADVVHGLRWYVQGSSICNNAHEVFATNKSQQLRIWYIPTNEDLPNLINTLW